MIAQSCCMFGILLSSVEQQLCYEHSLSLLTSITEFTVARKSWKKETAELFLHPNYFNMPSSCIDRYICMHVIKYIC